MGQPIWISASISLLLRCLQKCLLALMEFRFKTNSLFIRPINNNNNNNRKKTQWIWFEMPKVFILSLSRFCTNALNKQSWNNNKKESEQRNRTDRNVFVSISCQCLQLPTELSEKVVSTSTHTRTHSDVFKYLPITVEKHPWKPIWEN